MSAPVNPQINKLDTQYQEEGNAFQLLSLVQRLPTVYGSLLVECVRRREWSEKFQSNGQKLAEELALMKEDEEKRRRKWQRSTGGMLPFELGDTSQIVRAELNTRGDPSGGLPNVTRQDVEAYIATLKTVSGLEAVVKDLTLALLDIDKPSRRVNKRLKGFKMGSIHEANMMGSSMLGMGRNDDEIKVLRADKEQLSERIKGYESRIRKLEDLLHRGRTVSGNLYPSAANSTPVRPSTPGIQSFPSGQSPEQTHVPMMRTPSVSHRRSSTEVHPSTEPFKTRIAALMAELAAEKERATQLQREASENTESEKAMAAQITQADETKKDLVTNLKATVEQHTTELKTLEAEINELKEKLEKAYDDLDRMEEKMRPLESELEIVGGELSHMRTQHEVETDRNLKLEERVAEVVERSAEEIAALKGEVESQTRRADEAEKALAESERVKSALAEDVARIENELRETRAALDSDRLKQTTSQQSLMSSMKQAHGHLSTDNPPEDLGALMDQIEALVSKSVTRNKELSASLEAEKLNSFNVTTEKGFLQNRFDSRTIRAKDLTQRLYTHNARSIQLLESLGYKVVRGEDSMQILKVSRNSPNNESTILTHPAGDTAASTIITASTTSPAKPSAPQQAAAIEDINLLYWMESPDSDTESEKYSQYLKTIVAFDLDAFSETIINRVKKAEQDARHLVKQGRAYREKYYRARDDSSEKIAFKSFKQGDLALFLPTRNQVTRPWAAFNVGAPHFFLRETDNHKLATRDWLLARISRVEERQVDLSRSSASLVPPGSSSISDCGASIDDENPFELSDGLRWYLLDAVEEKAGAPTTPGLSASTVASANVDAKGSLKSRKPVLGAKKKLSEITTEHTRRSSSGSGNLEVVRALVGLEAAPEGVVVEQPHPPRTPVEKIVDSVRSRASSIRARTPAPDGR